MPAKVHNEGRTEMLDTLVGAVSGDIKVGLFTAPATPGVADGMSDLTEATFSGYGRVHPTWSGLAIDANGNAKLVGTACTFTHNAGGTHNTVLGYFVTNESNGTLYFSELFSAPITLNANGQFVTVTPSWYLGKLDPPL